MSLELDHLGSMDLYLGEKGTQGDMGGSAQVAAEQGVGQPVQLPLDLVDEDPNQPRREFDEEALQELAQTIALRGVRQPVSVRPHPQLPGRWMLNFGARRYRASRLAGKAEIPAFVDETADTYDQVIENEQRQGLKPLELANFIGARMKLGESQAEIARRLGKSKTLISFASALIDAPDWLLDLYRAGRCTGFHELYELKRLHALFPVEVDAWAQTRQSISRADLHKLNAELTAVPPAVSRELLVASSSGSISSATDVGGQLRKPVAGQSLDTPTAMVPREPIAPAAVTVTSQAPAPFAATMEPAPMDEAGRGAARTVWVAWRGTTWRLVVDDMPRRTVTCLSSLRRARQSWPRQTNCACWASHRQIECRTTDPGFLAGTVARPEVARDGFGVTLLAMTPQFRWPAACQDPCAAVRRTALAGLVVCGLRMLGVLRADI